MEKLPTNLDRLYRHQAQASSGQARPRSVFDPAYGLIPDLCKAALLGVCFTVASWSLTILTHAN